MLHFPYKLQVNEISAHLQRVGKAVSRFLPLLQNFLLHLASVLYTQQQLQTFQTEQVFASRLLEMLGGYIQTALWILQLVRKVLFLVGYFHQCRRLSVRSRLLLSAVLVFLHGWEYCIVHRDLEDAT